MAIPKSLASSAEQTQKSREQIQQPGPKKFLFISDEGLIGDLAYAVHNEGNEVRYFIRNKSEKDISDGFVEKVEDWESMKDWADVIIFDDIGFGAVAERLRKEGKAVIGGSVTSDRLELDRDFGQEQLKKAGLQTVPSWEFNTFDEAVNFVKNNSARYVVKPSGKAQEDKVLSFVGQEEDGLDVLAVLQRYKTAWSTKIKSFQIQRFVTGVEVAVGAFFNGEDFILPACINFEHKRMFNGEIGPSTGEMGTLIFWSEKSRLYDETLVKFRPILAEMNFVGYFDINCIVNSRGIYPLEITPRFGYPTINIQMEGITSKWGEFLYALANKQQFDLRSQRGFQIGVVVAVPPYPFSDPAAYRRYSEDAVIIFKKVMSSGIHHGDAKLVNGDWRLAGSSGYALVVTGSGQTVEDARRETYNRVRNVIIPNMFYRTDIGERWYRDTDLLLAWGYLS
ncbi:MAG TPA: phosphoribosylglycinamide synthetase C domain-containing protein [Methylomirabilota bacterium]|nr:phosphoribosylglycinamide synthetase C domain-containing protein [Methylomirabilota bacterium]